MPDPSKISFARRQWNLATSLRPRVLDRTHDMIGQHITLRHKTCSPEKDITATVQSTRVTIVCACAKYLRDIFNVFLFSEFGVVTRFSMRAISELEL